MNLAIIFTPFQYRCVQNYALEFNEPIKIVVLTSSKTNIKRILNHEKKYATKFPLQKLTFINGNISMIIKMIYVYFIRTKKYKKLIIGNFNNIEAYYLAIRFNKKGKETILLDDGLATLNIYSERNKKNELRNKKILNGRLSQLILKLFPILHKRTISCLTFYTLYNLKSIVMPVNDRIINFSFQNNNDNKEKKNDKDLIWFIGQPLVSLNIMKENEHKEILKLLKKVCEIKNKKLVYILHRLETPYKYLDIEYLKFEKSLEDIFIENDFVLPNIIITFYSSAILNIHLLNKDLNCFYIETPSLKSNPLIIEAYNYFRNSTELLPYSSTKILNN
jgi:hypothetical protein